MLPMRPDYYAFLLQTDRKLCSPMQAICTKLPWKAEKHNASLRISAMKCLPVSRPMANLSPSPDNMTEIRKCIWYLPMEENRPDWLTLPPTAVMTWETVWGLTISSWRGAPTVRTSSIGIVSVTDLTENSGRYPRTEACLNSFHCPKADSVLTLQMVRSWLTTV